MFDTKEPEFKFDLGSKAKHKITGFTGIIVCRTQWLTNCNVYGIKSTELKDGRPIDSQHFDEAELDVLEEKVIEPDRKTGGPTEAIPQTNR